MPFLLKYELNFSTPESGVLFFCEKNEETGIPTSPVYRIDYWMISKSPTPQSTLIFFPEFPDALNSP